MVKNPPAGGVRDVGLIARLGRSPGVGSGIPLQYSSLESSMGRGACVGYRQWGYKESDTTEHSPLLTYISK